MSIWQRENSWSRGEKDLTSWPILKVTGMGGPFIQGPWHHTINHQSYTPNLHYSLRCSLSANTGSIYWRLQRARPSKLTVVGWVVLHQLVAPIAFIWSLFILLLSLFPNPAFSPFHMFFEVCGAQCHELMNRATHCTRLLPKHFYYILRKYDSGEQMWMCSYWFCVRWVTSLPVVPHDRRNLYREEPTIKCRATSKGHQYEI